MPLCSAIKANGERCTRIVGASQAYCYAHDPGYATERRRAASKAAKSRANPEIREIKSLLKHLYDAVLGGDVGRQAAAVANQIANTQLRAIELERRIREHNELEGRLDELESLLDEAESRAHAGW